MFDLSTWVVIGLVAIATPLWIIAIDLGRLRAELRRTNEREDYRLRSELAHKPNTRFPPA